MKKHFTIKKGDLRDFINVELVSVLQKKEKSQYSVLLSGDLGSGKTEITRHILALLNVNESVTSPTFGVERGYSSMCGDISHFDLYRIDSVDPTLFNILFYSDQFLVLVEWFDLFFSPKDFLAFRGGGVFSIHLEYREEERETNTRDISLQYIC